MLFLAFAGCGGSGANKKTENPKKQNGKTSIQADNNQHGENDGLITLTKEIQEKIGLETDEATEKEIQQTISATGEFIAKPEGLAKVVSPLTGIILAAKNKNLPRVGTFVKKGAELIFVSPTADAEVYLQKIKSDYFLAKSELERVQLLYDNNAVAKKRLDEAKTDFENKQAIYNALSEQVKITGNGYSIVAPISGYVEAVPVSLGSHITAGQELMTIINSSRLILQVNVPAAKFEAANRAKEASFKVEGQDEFFKLSKLGGKKVAVSSTVNSSNRTVPVFFEFSNPKNSIKIGMFAEVFLKSGGSEFGVAIPEEAIVDEDGVSTAFVRIGPERFEKRPVEIGMKSEGFVQIISGIKQGEVVVTKGAYQVRLAQLSNGALASDGHDH
ncbi:MAG: efflux RND transporter periplasmic adaptor subunit [Ignavibacteriales bacterium]|nr:MAG: efflux RND transporter periplasmic adaptor subunit [Ignavibacteriaceae bacterium]MBW7873732.1 efflux RND transporter periplasmic adaptor subunit [Ignavibacteria bacterium]MBZ0195908.1 efflux RND transporter periplasmic adaptor subunit [Ignavibacteriaceae bacterium]MCZ2143957.1 efflux RND transporter periplasmic adaptor subunit [Ignavibacteriales bacterium]OQY74536.1 MAG: hypothetical protein B6D45_06780 [Ignavibacteriales bacterium UTCHB3]